MSRFVWTLLLYPLYRQASWLISTGYVYDFTSEAPLGLSGEPPFVWDAFGTRKQSSMTRETFQLSSRNRLVTD